MVKAFNHFIYNRDNLDTDIYGANIYNQILENYNHKKEKKLGQTILPNINTSQLNVENIEEDERANPEPNIHQNSQLNSHYSFLMNNHQFKSEAKSLQSILVRTGVFLGDQSDLDAGCNPNLKNYAHKDMILDNSLRKPNYLCENVYEAVKLIFEKENFL